MDFDAWLTRWLRRHPMKPLPDADRARYTAEVMANVKALESAAEEPTAGAAAAVVAAARPASRGISSPAWMVPARSAAQSRARRALDLWPRLWVAAATALATGIIVVSVRQPSLEIAAIVQEADQLAKVEPLLSQEPIQSIEELSGELEMMDAMMLAGADSSSDDQAWIEQTVQLLEALEEDLPESDEGSDDSWMDELELLDDSELTSS